MLKSRFFLGSIVISISVLFPLAGQARGEQCQALFSFGEKVELQVFKAEDRAAQQLNDFLNSQLLRQSAILEKRFRAEAPYIPVVVVGAGLHTSIFSVEAAHLGKASSVLAIESGSRVSKVFGDLAGSFRINSSERGWHSSNIFPGSPLQMKDITTQTFPNSVHLGTLGSAAQVASGVPVLFHNKVESIRDLSLSGGKAPGRYLVTTSQGLEIYTDRIVLATGLGEPSSRVRDPEFQKLLQDSVVQHVLDPHRVFPVMMVDSFLRTVALKVEGKTATDVQNIKGKKIAVIGAGDGARIAIEAIIQHMDPSVEVLWLGQKARTGDEYKETTWGRYFGLAEHMGTRIKGGYPGYVTAGRMKDGKVELTHGESGHKVQADYVINATGYDNMIPQLISEIVASAVAPLHINFEAVKGKVPEFTSPRTTIGKRLEVEGLPEQDIFVMGPAGGALATEKELKETRTENPVSIEVLGPRSRKMADSVLAEIKPTESPYRVQKSKHPQSHTFTLSVPHERSGITLKGSLLLSLARLEMVAALREFKFSDHQLSVRIEKSPEADLFGGHDVQVVFQEVSRGAAEKMIEHLRTHPDLLQVLKKLVQEKDSTYFVLQF